MVQWLRALGALAKGPSFIHSTHVVADTFYNFRYSLLTSLDTRYKSATLSFRQNGVIKNTKLVKSNERENPTETQQKTQGVIENDHEKKRMRALKSAPAMGLSSQGMERDSAIV